MGLNGIGKTLLFEIFQNLLRIFKMENQFRVVYATEIVEEYLEGGCEKIKKFGKDTLTLWCLYSEGLLNDFEAGKTEGEGLGSDRGEIGDDPLFLFFSLAILNSPLAEFGMPDALSRSEGRDLLDFSKTCLVGCLGTLRGESIGVVKASEAGRDFFDNQFLWNFIDKTGWSADPLSTKEASLLGMDKVEFFLGPGHAHITETPLLFHLLQIFTFSAMGEEALFHSCEEDYGKLQTLGAMKGHKGDTIPPVVVVVGVAHQSDPVEKPLQALILDERVVLVFCNHRD